MARSRSWVAYVAASSVLAGACAESHVLYDNLSGEGVACRTATNVERAFVTQSFETGTLLLFFVGGLGDDRPAGAWFGAARREGESFSDYRDRLLGEGVPVLPDVRLDVSADGTRVVVDGEVTVPTADGERTLVFSEDLSYGFCGS